MSPSSVVIPLLSCLVIFITCGQAEAGDKASRILNKNDANGDGQISLKEWPRSKSSFRKLDGNSDGALSLDELRARFSAPKNAIPAPAPQSHGETPPAQPAANLVSVETISKQTLCAMTRSRKCDPGIAVGRGMIETGLVPKFPKDLKCRGIDETWAMDYSWKRKRAALHGGIDMPAPFGTPMLAVANGTVVGKFMGERSARGIQIVLRHGPEDTGIPLWIYSLYAHFDSMPALEIGQKAKVGQNLGPTGNTGINPKLGYDAGKRRPAIHFAVLYSTSPDYAIHREHVIPRDGHWMDPNALYRGRPPLDSGAMQALPKAQKSVAIPIALDDGTIRPTDSKLVWPYACWRD
jgi:murein DD-endopeptidase MepM/ murein hydrolase activator NlpD